MKVEGFKSNKLNSQISKSKKLVIIIWLKKKKDVSKTYIQKYLINNFVFYNNDF